MSYRVLTVDLSNANGDKQQLVSPGQQIAEVFSLTFPDGAEFGLAFGQGDAITIDRPFSFAPDDPDTTLYGLFYTVPFAQPGVKVQIVVGGASVARQAQ